jgi:UDP-GlcNAc:undecaprenyl-phosphate GlcNAc-1-phosphate transferase
MASAILIAFVITLATVPLASKAARRLGAVATPRRDRLSERRVPMLGGLAITSGIVIGAFVLPMSPGDRLPLVLGVLAMAALGLADDLGSVSPFVRLSIEGVAAIAFVGAVSGGLEPSLRLAAILVAAVAFPVAINATNLVDNADGLAASLSVVTALVLAGLGLVAGYTAEGSGLAVVIAASCIGFLMFNLPPARVFMGDVGSLMLGFALAATSAFVVRDSVVVEGGAHAVVVVALPLAWALQVGDLAMVFITRVRRGESPFNGGVDHTSHRLLGAGLGPWTMLLALATLSAAIGAVAIGIATALGGFAAVAAAVLLVAIAVGIFEAYVAVRLPPGRMAGTSPKVGRAALDGGGPTVSDRDGPPRRVKPEAIEAAER